MSPAGLSQSGQPPAVPPPHPSRDFSYLAPIGYFKSSRCGYCRQDGKSQSQRYSYYAAAVSLTPVFYKTLLDRYWRRSGTLLYRPDQRRACCPHYTIRLDSQDFKPTKDQRQAVNKFNRHIVGEDYTKAAARLHPRSKAEAKRRNNVFDLSERIHECELVQIKQPPEPAHKFEVTLEDDTFTDEKFRVFENYQRVVHNEGPEEITREGFTRFLCESPIMKQTIYSPDGTRTRYGSFHQCYRLDGKLVAVGVLDLLPGCVSSVYLFYHESIHTFSPGKLSALREISLAIEKGYRYWYPGFYIHGCPKMRYKMDYSPQYMLDPETLQWDRCDDDLLALLTENPYVSLSREQRKAGPRRKGNILPENMLDQETDKMVMEITGQSDKPTDDQSDEHDEDAETIWLFATDMPGITPLMDMLRVNLDRIGVRVPGPVPDGFYTTSNLTAWDAQRIEDPGCFKASVAELVAAIGPDQVGNIRLAKRPAS
jgi:arginine-tRNA-protein transferase